MHTLFFKRVLIAVTDLNLHLMWLLLLFESYVNLAGESAVHNPWTNASRVSMTQYSLIYNNDRKPLEVWPFQNYQKS